MAGLNTFSAAGFSDMFEDLKSVERWEGNVGGAHSRPGEFESYGVGRRYVCELNDCGLVEGCASEVAWVAAMTKLYAQNGIVSEARASCFTLPNSTCFAT